MHNSQERTSAQGRVRIFCYILSNHGIFYTPVDETITDSNLL